MAAVVFYGLSTLYSVFLWRKGFREDNRVNYGLLAGGVIFHTMAMVGRGFSFSRCPVNNLYEMMVFISWTIVTSYLAIGLWSRLRFLGAFASPVLFGMGVFALMPALDPPRGDTPNFGGGWGSLHATLILLAFGAFGLSSVAALMYLTQVHDLKLHKARAIFSLLPPIQRLEQVAGGLLGGGFFLLTAGLLISHLLLKQRDGNLWSADPQILWSYFVWLLYLGLLMMRWWFAQGGKRFAWGTIASFVFVLLTFWGVYLLPGIHQR